MYDNIIFNKNIQKLDILLHRVCNLKCSYCYVNKQKESEFNLDLFCKGILLFVNSPGYLKKIILYGGEPFLIDFDKLIKLLDFIKNLKKQYKYKKDIKVTICTHLGVGILDNYEKVFSYIDTLSISIDGPEKSHDLNRGKGSFSSFKNNFFSILKNNPKYKEKIIFNKVLYINTLESLSDDVIYILENFCIPFGIELDIQPALGTNSWEQKHLNILLISYLKLYKTIKYNFKYLKYMGRLLELDFQRCIYSGVSLNTKGEIHNCGFISNNSENHKFLYDLNTNSKNPDLDIDNCNFDLTKESCIIESCSICKSACTNENIYSHKKLNKNKSNIQKEIKNKSNILDLFLKDNPIDIINIKFKIYSNKEIVLLNNFINSLFKIVNNKILNLYIENYSDINILTIKYLFLNKFKLLNIKLKISFVNDFLYNEKFIILDGVRGEIYNNNYKKIGTSNTSISVLELLK